MKITAHFFYTKDAAVNSAPEFQYFTLSVDLDNKMVLKIHDPTEHRRDGDVATVWKMLRVGQ